MSPFGPTQTTCDRLNRPLSETADTSWLERIVPNRRDQGPGLNEKSLEDGKMRTLRALRLQSDTWAAVALVRLTRRHRERKLQLLVDLTLGRPVQSVLHNPARLFHQLGAVLEPLTHDFKSSSQPTGCSDPLFGLFCDLSPIFANTRQSSQRKAVKSKPK